MNNNRGQSWSVWACGVSANLEDCVIAGWYVLGRRYSASCSKGNLDGTRYRCKPYPGLCNLVDYFVNKS